MTITTRGFANVNVGSSANDGTGDDLRSAFIRVNENFSNVTSTGFSSPNVVVTNRLGISSTNVPTLANSAGTTGQITWDSNYLYVCTATNNWKRANLVAW
jgi:hypothetical protein